MEPLEGVEDREEDVNLDPGLVLHTRGNKTSSVFKLTGQAIFPFVSVGRGVDSVTVQAIFPFVSFLLGAVHLWPLARDAYYGLMGRGVGQV